MPEERPSVLSIAGFDPSAGAGLLADIKTFEGCGVYGCGIASALTWQNDVHFEKLNWLPFEEMEGQFKTLSGRFSFSYVKIGILPDVGMLNRITTLLKNHNPGIKIIWDPVLKASAGFDFLKKPEAEELKRALKGIYLITPNIHEAQQLSGMEDANNGAGYLSRYTHVLLKGGHKSGPEAEDILFANGQIIEIKGERKVNAAKHGSGCVLSAAITAFLEKGLPLEEACKQAKTYVTAFLQSSPGLTGFHYAIKNEFEAARV
jgi:hydroxymethylpyrimidine/phosphomethylpyrimidine kinase